ncbi:putative major facilitator superfamily transporter [Gordonia polyisoprenivorans VH2]|uniref:MFS transporter n=2 Tax=Gordonia polyisoprenivorans TaxID=84595 RepID=A0A846WLQ0_9ACTN|nr:MULTISPECIES: MDR family MFS transporter [Gordonia]AFA75345.1 putative major facilitator superfamily transporter [Gordonia polyisoprenivorans VH2]MBE7191780.1 MFS transporter [Gordonia polyisoprenivorans]MDF3284260.1 MDR family MFS transporter [Gordonia sp. N1V]NKY01733.1 MFS transporter [Gordonia polyisoprenivorans]OZC32274.1 MFS transporter [Gordonia polyisoprenivorans]
MTNDNVTTSAVSPPEEHAGAGLSHRQILTVLTGLMLGMFLAALDQTIVSTAIRTIADDLQGYDMQAWVTTAYLVTSTIVTPLYGKLSDLYGRKPFFLLAISIFVIGSLACSMATSMYELAAFRAFQGLGAGGLFTLALTTIGDIVPPRERAKYQGYFLAVFGTSSVLGPVLGGLFAGQSSILWVSGWRWVFLVNVPIGILALAVVYRVLNYDQNKGVGGRTDYWGATALAVTVAPLLIVAEQGREWGWLSGWSWLCYIVGAVGLAVFVFIEHLMGDDALIPLRVFKNRVFAQGIVVSMVVGAVMFGGISMLPQYFQVLRGSSPMVAGLQMLPMVLGLMTGSVLSGQLISRTGRYKIFTILGSVLITVMMFMLHTVGLSTPVWLVMIYAFFLGFGLGNLMQPITLAMQNILPPKDMGLSTGTATFFRQIGATLGVAVFFSMLFSLMGPNIKDEMVTAAAAPQYRTAVMTAASSPDPQVSGFAKGLISAAQNPGAGGGSASESVMSDTSVISKLPTELAQPIKQGFANSMDRVFLTVSIISLLAIIGTVTWKELPLRRGKPLGDPESTGPAQ